MATTDMTVQVRTAFADVVDLIPRRARLVIFVLSAVCALAALGAQRIVAIWWPELQQQVDATVAEILPWLLFINGMLGAAYRASRPTLIPLPPEPGPLELAQAQEMQARTVATLMANGWDKNEATQTATQQALLPTGESPGWYPRTPT